MCVVSVSEQRAGGDSQECLHVAEEGAVGLPVGEVALELGARAQRAPVPHVRREAGDHLRAIERRVRIERAGQIEEVAALLLW
jgi:hypothetical protein